MKIFISCWLYLKGMVNLFIQSNQFHPCRFFQDEMIPKLQYWSKVHYIIIKNRNHHLFWLNLRQRQFDKIGVGNYHYINYMRKIKQLPVSTDQSNNHFLIRPSSASNLNVLQCLFPCSAGEIELTYKPKIQPQKKSMKNLLQRSSSQIYKTTQIDESKLNEEDKKTLVYNASSILKHRQPSELTQISNSSINIHSQKTTPKKHLSNTQRILKKPLNQAIYDQNEDNNVTKKYIIQDEELDEMDKTIQHQLSKNQLYSYDFTALEDELPDNTDTSPKWNHQVQTFAPPERSSHKEITPNTYRFSFGQHQNKMFMNKFKGFREVSSNRPSKESFSSEDVSLGLKDQFLKPNSMNTNNRSRLQAMVRDVHIMDEEFDDFSESNSEVLERHQNMSMIQ